MKTVVIELKGPGAADLGHPSVTDAKGKAVDPKDDKVFRHFAESFRVE